MKIFNTQPQDIEKILPLYLGYRQFYQVEEQAAQAKDFLLNRLQLGQSVIFFAEVDNKPVGFTQLYPLFCSLEMKRIWLLYDLYVDESARKHGVAAALMARAEQLANETDSAFIMLSTATDNTRAQSLYEAKGYVRDEAFYNYVKMLNQ